jgi:hypothetical protein
MRDEGEVWTHTLRELAELSDDLNAKSDGLNRYIEEREAEIRATKVTCFVEVLLEPGVWLQWGRSGKTWGLRVRFEGSAGSDPLLSCMRDIRLASLDKLTALMQALINRSKMMIDQIFIATGPNVHNRGQG